MAAINKWLCMAWSLAVFAVLVMTAGMARAGLPIQHWQSASGARVYFVENHALPILDVSVNFAAGNSRDTPDKAGIAALTHSLLALGAGGLSDDRIAERFADLGAVPGGDFDLDRAALKLRVLSSERERLAAAELFALLLQQPDFPAEVLEREKARAIATLREEKTRPESLAERAFGRSMFGSHPYSLGDRIEPESLEAVTQDDLVAFHRKHYTRRGAVLALVGDISRAQAEDLAEQLTSALPEGEAALAVPPVPALVQATEQRIAHPAAQAHILLGQPGLRRMDADYFPLYVGNYILGGGGFVSRLTEEVREKRGLAYSVYSYFMPMSEAGPFQIGLQTRREQADEALELVRNTLRRFVRSGPSEKELASAKANLAGGFALRLDSNSKMLEYLAVIGFYGLPLTWLDEYVERINKVTMAQVREAFARRIQPDRMVTVIVGGTGK